MRIRSHEFELGALGAQLGLAFEVWLLSRLHQLVYLKAHGVALTYITHLDNSPRTIIQTNHLDGLPRQIS